MAAGFAMRSMSKGVKSMINIYNMDIYNPASTQAILKAVNVMHDDLNDVEVQINGIMEVGNAREDATLQIHHRSFTGATSVIKESLSQLSNIVKLAGVLKDGSKETTECMNCLVDSVRRQFNNGFDQARDSFNALRTKVDTTPRLRESAVIKKIMEEIGDNMVGAEVHEDRQERLNCLDNVREGQVALNNAVDDIYNDLDCPQEEQQQLRQVRNEMFFTTKMWDMVFYFGHVLAFVVTLGVSVNRAV
ncbi:uncharacterized protein LOC144449331 [Glandiceps talaboti]